MERVSTNAQLRPLLTVRQVAELLHVSPSTVRRRIEHGEIPAVRLGIGPQAPVRVDAAELEDWLFSLPPDGEASRRLNEWGGDKRLNAMPDRARVDVHKEGGK
jgi:excisionase family DNA binding protein